MSATPHCGGPAHLYVGNFDSPVTSCRYLGACEETPAYLLYQQFVEIHTDSGGSAVGEDEYVAGEFGVITLALTVWDGTALDLLAAMPLGFKDGSVPAAGTASRRSRGTLLGRGRNGAQLVVQNQLYNTLAATPDLDAGVRFKQVRLDSYGLGRTDTGGQLLVLNLIDRPAKTKANHFDVYDTPSEIEQLRPDIKIY